MNLRNNVESRQSLYNGFFTEQNRKINGRAHFLSSNSQLAIWYTSRNLWCIGQVSDLGTDTCSLHSTNSATCPQFVGSQWNYWTGTQFLRGGSDAQVQCQRGNSHSFMLK